MLDIVHYRPTVSPMSINWPAERIMANPQTQTSLPPASLYLRPEKRPNLLKSTAITAQHKGLILIPWFSVGYHSLTHWLGNGPTLYRSLATRKVTRRHIMQISVAWSTSVWWRNSSQKLNFLNDESLKHTSRTFYIFWRHFSYLAPIPALVECACSPISQMCERLAQQLAG